MANTNTQRLKSVDALRGIAILMVILVHSSQRFPYLSLSNVKYFYYWCQMGVQLFFLASSFTLCLSLKRSNENGESIGYFYLRRFFRIAPGYYMGILLYAIINIIYYSIKFNRFTILYCYTFKNIICNIFLIQGMVPSATSGIVPGGWSVGTECIFYLIFPIIFKIISSPKIQKFKLHILAPFITLLGSFYIEYLIYKLTGHYVQNNHFIYYNIVNQIPIFVMGMSIYFAYINNKLKHFNSVLCFLLFGVTAYFSILLMYRNLDYKFMYLFIPFISAISLAFLFIGFLNLKIKFTILEKIGTISYSCYLLHFIFAFFLSSYLLAPLSKLNSNLALPIFYLIVVVCTYFLASLSYKYIELNGIKLGKMVTNAIRNKSISQRETATVTTYEEPTNTPK